MRVALYARVSTTRQAQAQTIEQQLTRLRSLVEQQGWILSNQHIYRDDGFSGASLNRPGLDRLRDAAAQAAFDAVLITAPDRLARKYVHQVLLIEELEGCGCQVRFSDRPMSDDPHDQLLLQIRGAVAEYERVLITDRMRRGRLAKLRAGQLLPWSRPPYGYQIDPQHPRDPTRVRADAITSVIVQQIFAWYLEPQATLYQVTLRLSTARVPTATGKQRWTTASIRNMLTNPAYTGTAYANRTREVAARKRRSALQPLGRGTSYVQRQAEDWIPIAIPAIVEQEVFAQVQAKLRQNQRQAPRNNRAHTYLLRALVSCGHCQHSVVARALSNGYHYYICRRHTTTVEIARDDRCRSRYIPTQVLDDLVWEDLCAILTAPEQLTAALARAQSGEWLPQELQARRASVQQALAQSERQQERLLSAYLAEVIDLQTFERNRVSLQQQQESLTIQQRELAACAQKQLDLSAIASSIEAFCVQTRAGLANASFEKRRALVELLIDRVIVTDSEVEIHYVIPTSPASVQIRFCHLSKVYHSHFLWSMVLTSQEPADGADRNLPGRSHCA
jgi:site-specific DNA recombinase